jgi:hypothetical protein
MARIDGVSDGPASLVTRALYRAAKRLTGAVPDPLRIMAHSKPVMWAAAFFEAAFGRAHAVPPRLKALASIKVASMVGCVF